MKSYWATLLMIGCILSCTPKKETMEKNYKISNLTSNVLLQNTARIYFTRLNHTDELTLIISGKTILNGIAIFKVTNDKGEELYCESFPAKKLIQSSFRTANSTLQENHIRTVVAKYFEK